MLENCDTEVKTSVSTPQLSTPNPKLLLSLRWSGGRELRHGGDDVTFNSSISTLKSQKMSFPGDRVLEVCGTEVKALYLFEPYTLRP